MVMNIEVVRKKEKQVGPHSHKHQLADVWIVPVSSLGKHSGIAS